MILYKSLGLSAREAAEIMVDITEMIEKKMSDEEIAKKLAEKYSGVKLSFAALTLGRLIGMSYAVSDREKAKGILVDFKRFLRILRIKGRDELVKVIEREILEETFREIEELKDVV
ncbi:hypothetical protein B6U96_15905 [Archaeoglobales archaeon ex4484_92]|nr:MAG: hypothetical protein B6U96_15905 [Archaeoglobales archaeon ex4484_92]